MGHGLKCYCCCINDPILNDSYYCEICLQKLSKAFKDNVYGIIDKPKHMEHCISCGEWEERRIILTGRGGLFSSQVGDGVPICERCVRKELLKLQE